MIFVVDKVALGQVFLRLLRFPPVSIIPPVLHTHLYLHTVLQRRTNGRSLGTSQKAMLFRNLGGGGGTLISLVLVPKSSSCLQPSQFKFTKINKVA
jgi:hypothetical protein